MRRIVALVLVAAVAPLLAGCAALSGPPQEALERELRDAGFETTQVRVDKGYNGFNAELSVDIVLDDEALSSTRARELIVLVAETVDPASYRWVSIAVGHDPVGELDRTDIEQFDLGPAARDLGLTLARDETASLVELSGEQLARAKGANA